MSVGEQNGVEAIPWSSTQFRLDQFGFIRNMDAQGRITLHSGDDEEDYPLPVTWAEAQRNTRREQKWNAMIAAWSFWKQRRRRKTISRLRKGVPPALRDQVWKLIASVPDNSDYEKYLKLSLNDDHSTNSVRIIQDTIERDIHRTFPRHSMFHQQEPGHHESNGDSISKILCDQEIADMVADLNQFNTPTSSSGNSTPTPLSPDLVLEPTGGQASLRRVLKAYSMYDKNVGYCQGMNFIAGMFITVMKEQDAFWMLVYVMRKAPCRMQGLFGEGMRETHKVLYVGEKLIQIFLPKLHQHFQREHIQVTMFATQWLLTVYTSSFPFELVLRIWDAFLFEGWKITYRVMLALLQTSQNDLLAMGFEDMLAYFRDLPTRVDRSIMDVALRIPLRRANIRKLEKDFYAQHEQQK